MIFNRSVKVRLTFEGLHCWPESPASVDFLRAPHRHIFHVTLELPVEHHDREVEFILLKRMLDGHLRSWPTDLGRKSCEEMAEDIIRWTESHFPNRRFYRCEVSEDGENGAMVEAYL
jgi:hypothetical protein